MKKLLIDLIFLMIKQLNLHLQIEKVVMINHQLIMVVIYKMFFKNY